MQLVSKKRLDLTSFAIKREIIAPFINYIDKNWYQPLAFLLSALTIACNHNRYHYQVQPIETDQVQLSPPAQENCFLDSADLNLMFKY